VSNLTPFQTVGPYLRLGLRAALGPIPPSYPCQRIVIRGRLLDGRQTAIPDGVLEWWHPALPTLQRTPTEDNGTFVLETIKPGRVSAPTGLRNQQAPHFAVRVLGRGLLTQYITRVYFPDEPDTADDHILGLVPHDRRHTLIAQVVSPNEYRFDVVVQGADETVFFDF